MHATSARKLVDLLHAAVPPVAVAFVDDPPAGVARVQTPEPAGCGYWRRAAEGATFYTTADDHLGCPIGAHTHAVDMPPEKAKELQGLVGTMVGLEYLTMDDVAALPQRRTPLKFAVYAPLADTPVEPDVVLLRANSRQMMLLSEASQAAGAAAAGPTLGRPTCVVLPVAIESARTASSFGCVGNRVYTGASDDEGWFAIPGASLENVVARLETIVRANEALEAFHRARV